MDVDSGDGKMRKNNLFKKQEERDIEQNNININKKKSELQNIDYNVKDMILTQDILEGSWDLNSQTKLFIQNNKDIYDKAKEYFNSLNCYNEKIIITFIIIKYLILINKKEYILIIQKGIQFLKDNNLDYNELIKD